MTRRAVPAALAAAGLVAAGWWTGVRVHRRGCEERWVRLYRYVRVLELNQDHTVCKVKERTMADYIAHQERELDTLRAGADVADQAEEGS